MHIDKEQIGYAVYGGVVTLLGLAATVSAATGFGLGETPRAPEDCMSEITQPLGQVTCLAAGDAYQAGRIGLGACGVVLTGLGGAITKSTITDQ